MSRNYGLGSRHMTDAVRILLFKNTDKGTIAFSSAGTNTYRFSKFAKFLKRRNVNRLEHVTRTHCIEYGKGLAFKTDLGELSPAYCQNLVSAVNTVFELLRPSDWETVSPTKDCGIPRRRLKRVRPTIPIEAADEAVESLRENNYSVSLAVELALQFGMRIKEASLFDAKIAYKEALKIGVITIKKGTKGGRKRVSSELNVLQIDLLKRVSDFQGNNRSLMPADESWQSWCNKDLKRGREVLHRHGIKGYHEFRALFAAMVYEEIMCCPAPVNGGVVIDKKLDAFARLSIAKLLGHNRSEIAAAYIGGRK